MSPRKTADVIDGFSSVQAVKRGAERKKTPVRKSPQESGAASPENPVAAKTVMPADSFRTAASKSQTATDAGSSYIKMPLHSVMPSKRLIICYICGYSHTITGKMYNPFCPKCKTKLNTEDITITDEFTKDILTIGNIKILNGAKIKEGIKILGQNVMIDADVSAVASITATESLELCSNVKFKAGTLNNINGLIRIPRDNIVNIAFDFNCRLLEVYGALTANISVREYVHLYAGSFFKGVLYTASLIVEDGADMSAEINLSKANKVLS